MSHVWIAQCLCPERHAIMAVSGEADNAEDAADITWALREKVEELLHSRAINPWCGLCNALSFTWRYELGLTRFRTMEEATAELRRNEAEQAVTRQLYGDMPRSD